MDEKTHFKIGAIIGITASTVYLIKQVSHKERLDLGDLGTVELLMTGYAVASMLPDIIEPALNPMHRQFFHSVSCLILIGLMLYKINDSTLESKSKELLSSLFVGYISHLIADLTTPAGLPLVGEI
ncbi:TPA: hypothetical protein DCW38_06525 [candidate division WOR-3 bacterium]|uniref:Metal-dependent hydrolase n=1 Tax=candidate division WOR-3 bacterium TaxID=2052148 RepID=A0A350HBA2_UNCW3|nr:hypothetical protein [candidate division WOR-3 bacterium]